MAMPAQPTEWTVEMVRALPDDSNRYEVIDGELFVTPAPSVAHQRAVLELALLVAPYVRAHRIGEALISPADVIVYGPRKFVQPDLFVVPLVNGAPMRAWTDVGRLLLTVEVLSPSTERTDRGRKRTCTRRRQSPSTGLSIPMSEPSNAGVRTIHRSRSSPSRSSGSRIPTSLRSSSTFPATSIAYTASPNAHERNTTPPSAAIRLRVPCGRA